MRTLDELLDREDSALPILREWIDDPAGNGGILAPPVKTVAVQTLVHLQVTTRSTLGAVAYETGGISIADGLLRLLGSSAERSLIQSARIAGCPLDGSYPDVLIVGDDVFGGLFALNGGRFGAERQGQIFHLPADDIFWVPLGIGHSDFVHRCVTRDLSILYASLTYLDVFARRPLPAFNATFSFYPFLWTKEGKDRQPSVEVISADENLKLRLELCGFVVS